ncbi:MAG: DUF1570 domain-containing protein [Planctomycetota bacterium]|nr:MAG: DUF1570 domain-containing protein [Planctomycetota bacterium]REK31387.1 MAG: DUF1570 domain-containing protein [Planctomycetota bacterium]REK39110.1 MAG: DUF1570 domain-containing protein [Planctomycetota bacterium]
MSIRNLSLVVTAAFLFAGFGRPVAADTFTYIDQEGEEQTVEARLRGSGQETFALETADGQWVLVPEGNVIDREAAKGPEPISADEMVGVLEVQFGAERVRTHQQKPYVVCLVLAGPLDRRSESRVRGFLQKAGRFMQNVERVFERFAKDTHFPLREPEHPLVLVIFESDADFNEYTVETTGGVGMSAGNIAGFYAKTTNWLAIRMEECRTFQVPLHEAIHQLMYNRVLQRFAPIPAWFDEGIATGFEADGDRVDVHPAKINSLYALLAKSIPNDDVSWVDVVSNDNAFRGDILAGEAYIEAWCLHWMLVTQHTDAYEKYVQELAAREPLQELSSDERTERFEDAFGVTVGELAADFPRVLKSGLKRQKVKAPDSPPPGISLTEQALSEVKMKAVNDVASGRLLVEGSLKNASPIRPLTFHVAVVSGSGVYTDWVVDDVGIGKTVSLPGKVAAKVLPGAPGGSSRTFQVRVQWALPDSDEAAAWKRSPPLPAGFEE